MITKIEKRDGRHVPFNIEKISNAIFKALSAEREANVPPTSFPALALSLAEKVVLRLEKAPRQVRLQHDVAPNPNFQYVNPALLVESGEQEYPPHVD